MKSPPFNACDYLCEKCRETEHCSVYAVLRQKADSKQVSGGKAHEPGQFLEDVKESLDEAMEMLHRIAADFSIDLSDIQEGDDLNRYFINSDELYQLSVRFTNKAHGFLKKIEAIIEPEIQEFFDDLVWYHTLVSVKTHRAISSDYEGFRDDALDSAGVAMKSSLKCMHAFDQIERSNPELADECRSLSRTASAIKKELQKRYINHAITHDDGA
jgi:glutamyl-tRNA reductase